MIAVNSGKKLLEAESLHNRKLNDSKIEIGKQHSSKELQALEDSLGKAKTDGAKSGTEVEDQLK